MNGKAKAQKTERVCRVCGCTQSNACVNLRTGLTCSWYSEDLCSACRPSQDQREWQHPKLKKEAA